MALRVLPSLSLPVTTEEVRKRKRLVMIAAGLVAYGAYQLAKFLMPLGNIWLLLVTSGVLASIAAVVAFAIGRRIGLGSLWRTDGFRMVAWIVVWIGFVYGIQLSLMVLALLKVVVRYDYLLHPDGPAMMAIIIACTSVARDAFEIGHVRRLQHVAEPIVTFPDGSALRTLVATEPFRIAGPTVLTAAVTVLIALVAAALGDLGASHLAQLVLVSMVSGTGALLVYLRTKQPQGSWVHTLNTSGWTELVRFWWWPGLAFAATYYLTLQGVLVFIAGSDLRSSGLQALLAGMVGAAMGLYCAYLGHRRAVEDRLNQNVPSSLLRCPFVLNILSKGRPAVAAELMPEAMMAREGRR